MTVDDVLVVLIAAACAGVTGLIGLALLRFPPRLTLRTTVFVSIVTAVSAVVAGVVGTARAMFLSAHDLEVVLVVCAVAGLVAAGLGAVAGRRLVAETATVRRAALQPDQSDDHLPRTVELAEVTAALRRRTVELAAAADREARLEASRRELVAWVSHDLRTPLAGLRAIAEALEDGVADDPDAYLKRLRQEVHRLSGMVDDLFELSRLQAGEAPRRRADVDVRDLLSDAVAATEPLARTQDVRVQGSAPPGLMVSGDEAALHRAVVNLIVNAVRHTAAGGTVSVQARIEAAAVVLSVADACGGIPPQDLDRVFDVGWRGAASRPASPVGAPGAGGGLGLAIVQGVAAAHGGDVRVVNSGPGCRFDVSLPRS